MMDIAKAFKQTNSMLANIPKFNEIDPKFVIFMPTVQNFTHIGMTRRLVTRFAGRILVQRSYSPPLESSEQG